MGRSALPIRMESGHREFYEKLQSKHSIPKNEYLRMSILLLSHGGMNNSEVSRELNISLNTVKHWRRRWEENYNQLLELKGEEERSYLKSFLKDSPRSGTPKKFTMAQEQSIVALACEHPRDHGIEMTDWTMEMLCKVAGSKQIVESISTSQVSRLLKNTALTTA